jgi:hypothetical protein
MADERLQGDKLFGWLLRPALFPPSPGSLKRRALQAIANACVLNKRRGHVGKRGKHDQNRPVFGDFWRNGPPQISRSSALPATNG